MITDGEQRLLAAGHGRGHRQRGRRRGLLGRISCILKKGRGDRRAGRRGGGGSCGHHRQVTASGLRRSLHSCRDSCIKTGSSARAGRRQGTQSILEKKNW